jgi:hypothetical protein
MTLFDGQVGKQNLFERLVDGLMNRHRLVLISTGTFSICTLMVPVVVYINFAYLSSAKGPWWLNLVTGLYLRSFFFSGFVLFILGLAKLIESRQD